MEYTHRFSDRDGLRVTGGLKYSDKYIVNDILPQPDYLKIDAGVALDHGPVTFSVVGRNLGNHLDCGVASPQPLTTGSGEVRRIVNRPREIRRSEEHTSELQSLMRISYAVFCLK